MSTDLMTLARREGDGSHLTAKQVAKIERYCRRLLKVMRNTQWTVEVARDLPPADCLAMIDPCDGRRVAMLFIHEDWWDSEDADKKRHTLVHEMLHLMHHDQDDHVRTFSWKIDVHQDVKELFMHGFKTETERMVDHLAYVMAPFMPEWK